MSFPTNDILLLISEDFHDQTDKLQLLLVCRNWYSLLLPKAYKTISVHRHQIYFLARSVQQNPKIGAAIRNLTLTWESGPGPADDYEVDMLMKTLKQKGNPEDNLDDWEVGLRTGCPDAWLTVLVLSLESIKSMDLRFSYSPYFLPMLARIAAKENPFSSKPVLQHLEKALVRVENMKEYYDACDLLPFFYLPAMRVFTAGGICEDEPCIAPLELGTSGIREIDLGGYNTNNGSRGMADYITSCANLEIFDYQHDNKAIWGESYIEFYPLLFYSALSTQKHSLRELRLNNHGENYPVSLDDDERDLKGFGSLTEFHQLRELQIPLHTLLQFDSNNQPKASLLEILPRSLEYLNLAVCREEEFDGVIKNLRGMLAQREERFPNLKKLEVHPYVLEMIPGATIPHSTNFAVPVSTQQLFAPIEIACRDMGIQFGFRKDGNCTIRRA